MKSALSTYYERLRASYWFIPGVMIFGAILLSFITIALDETYPSTLEDFLGWIDISDPDGAHTFLSVVSSSMISVTGVTFSITIVALVQASSQLGPRILNTFLRDRGNQVVLGTLLSTYTFCLLVIRSVTTTNEYVFIPHFSLFIAILLAIFSVALLVYFFHHVTVLLQAEHVIAVLGRDLDRSIEKLFPKTLDYSIYGGQLKSQEDLPPSIDEKDATVIKSESAGYLQAIDINGLVSAAADNNLFLRAIHRPGDFIQKEGQLIELWADAFKREFTEEKLQAAFIIGDQRLRINDIEFLVNQLVEIAVRALSPGINDPFTAIACINQLGSGLSGLMARSIPQGYHYDSEGKLRLLTESLTFSGIIEAAFNQIRQNAFNDVAVTLSLLDAIRAMAPNIQTLEQKDTLAKQAEMLNRSKDGVPEKWDRDVIQERFDSVMKEIQK